MPTRYRMYIDESGDHTYKKLADISRRCLALTGIVIEANSYRTAFQPQLEALKQMHFPHSPDEPIILVRTELLNKRGPFHVLQDPAKADAWGKDFASFVATSDYVIISAVIDKQEHLKRYGDAAFHPYHYCLAVLLERFIGFLRWRNGIGDVMAESRGGTEDTELGEVYSEVYLRGTFYHSADEFQRYLTSRELKLKKKQQNIAGLQMADLLAAPSKMDILAEKAPKLCPPFGAYTQQLIAAMTPKYNPYGRVLLD